MSSEETLVEELDLSAASIGRNFSVKLQLKKLTLGIIKNQVEMLYSTNTCHNHNHHCYAQISRQVLSEKVTVRLERDQILRETGRLYNFQRLYIMQPCVMLQSAKYQIYSPVILFSPFMFLGGWKSL